MKVVAVLCAAEACVTFVMLLKLVVAASLAMLILHSTALISLLLKKERDKLAPGARFARSGGPLAASFFL